MADMWPIENVWGIIKAKIDHTETKNGPSFCSVYQESQLGKKSPILILIVRYNLFVVLSMILLVFV